MPLVVFAVALSCSTCQRASSPPEETPAPSLSPRAAESDTQRAAARPTPPATPTKPALGPHDVGAVAPAMKLETLDGDTIDLGALYGTKPVYLKFWATWCIPCREQMPKLKRIYDSVKDRVHVIAVNDGFNDEEAAVRAFRADNGLRMPVVVDDGRLAAALDLQVTVQHVVIGRDARIVYRGEEDGDALDDALRKVMADAAPDVHTAGREPPAVRPAFKPGDLVETVDVKTIDGTAVTLGRSRKPRAVMFFSTWSETYLQKHFSKRADDCRRVRELVERLAATKDVDWLGIAGGPWQTTDDVVEYRATTKTKLPLALDADGSLFRAFGIRDVPTVALLDREGRLTRVVRPDDRDLADAVRALRGH
jgi:peroxiredoxin